MARTAAQKAASRANLAKARAARSKGRFSAKRAQVKASRSSQVSGNVTQGYLSKQNLDAPRCDQG